MEMIAGPQCQRACGRHHRPCAVLPRVWEMLATVNLDKRSKGNNSTHVTAAQTLLGRPFSTVVGHLVPSLLFTGWPETTSSPPVLKIRNTFRHVQCLTTKKEILTNEIHTYSLKQKYVVHILLSENLSQKTGSKRVFS